MSVFRPAVRFQSPDGRAWELYAYRTKEPLRRTRRLARLGERLVVSVRALRGDAWTIQAITWAPIASSYTWTTTTEFRGQVLAQVEGNLARGDVPLHLTNATFRGASRR
jgi:hypothetical protein